jgi:hypothetical protein
MRSGIHNNYTITARNVRSWFPSFRLCPVTKLLVPEQAVSLPVNRSDVGMNESSENSRIETVDNGM